MSPPAIGRRAAVGSAAASDWSSYSGCSLVESEVEHGSSWTSPASPSWRKTQDSAVVVELIIINRN